MDIKMITLFAAFIALGFVFSFVLDFACHWTRVRAGRDVFFKSRYG